MFLCNERLQNFAFVVDSPPKIGPLSSYLHEDLIQVPQPLRASTHGFGSPLPDFVREVCAEPVATETDALMADINAALVKQVLYVPKRERKSDMHQHAKLDDLGRRLEVAKRVLCHFPRLNARIGHLESGSADSAVMPSQARLP